MPNAPVPGSVAALLAGLQHVVVKKKEADAAVEVYTANLRQQLLAALAAGGTTGDRYLDFLAQAHQGWLLPGFAAWLRQFETYVQARAGQPIALVRTRWHESGFRGGPHHQPTLADRAIPEAELLISVLTPGPLQFMLVTDDMYAAVALPTLPRHLDISRERDWRPETVIEPLPALHVWQLLGWLNEQPDIIGTQELSDDERTMAAHLGGIYYSLATGYDEKIELVIGTDAWLMLVDRIIEGFRDANHPRHPLVYYQYSAALGHTLPRLPRMKAELEALIMSYHDQTEQERLKVQTAEQAVTEANARLEHRRAEERALIDYLASFPPGQPPPE